MPRRTALPLSLLALALPSLLLVGCATGGPGRGTSLFPQGYPLSDAAQRIRWANAQPLHLARELEKEPLPPYVVEPGDVLLVQPVDLDAPVRLPGDQPVLPDGTINLARYGRLVVAGKTVGEIETLVQAAVRAQTKDAGFISVRLVARQSKVYYVLGEVNSPGAFQLSGRETVLDALMAAGGLTDNASRDNIILTRPSRPNCCRTVLPICFNAIVQLGDTTTNYQIAPGDRIYVPSRTLLESLIGHWCNKSPCKCVGDPTPCNLPPYQPGPCPEDVHGQPTPGFGTPLPTVSTARKGPPLEEIRPQQTPTPNEKARSMPRLHFGGASSK